MTTKTTTTTTQHNRNASINLTADQFRELGHRLVDQIAELYAHNLRDRPVNPAEEPETVRSLLDSKRHLPADGADPNEIVKRATELLFDHSVYNGHPGFMAYITAPAAPIGVLADMLAAAVNPNVGGWMLSPMATEIELQTVRWIAELIGYPVESGGLLVSGGNMANFVGFLAARRVKGGEDLRSQGMGAGDANRLRAYCSRETHTWVEKAGDLFGLGTEAIRKIDTDKQLRMRPEALRAAIDADLKDGLKPFCVIGTAGSVSTGAIDPLPEIAAMCKEYDLWFHVDGAYGGFAAAVPSVDDDIRGLSLADSVAVDPHKWLYSPLEAGCALVREPEHLIDTFSYHPPYYIFEDETLSLVDYGLQNSRGFRALKVWLMLQQVGRNGYEQMITDDIQLAAECYNMVDANPNLEALSHSLS
ncbi:MAG: aminotransferase class V-fold PLP-dependent enzyme, partial [candidate division Zixibacteria bacterium]|nr:aminotransferase class V-fold PLP-dependent enzyme [candidate division Zixibacteria bacterium]